MIVSAPKMKPGGGGGTVQNAKAQASQRQNYTKGGASAKKYPGKRPGMSGDTPKARKALVTKKK